MVSIEDKLRLVGLPRLGQNVKGKVELDIDVAKESRDFELAQQNVKRMTELRNDIIRLLKKRSRINPFKMKDKKIERELKIDKTKLADIQFELRYSKTPYENIVSEMENRLFGIIYHASRGGDLTDVIVKDDEPYIHAQYLLDDFGITVAGNLNPNVECNVKPTREFRDPKKFVVIPAGAYKEVSWNTILLLHQINIALGPEKKYVKLFKDKASEGAPKKKTRVTPTEEGNEAVEGKIMERTTIDYIDVVRTLVPVPMEHHEREWDPELPYLVREDLTLGQLYKWMSWYKLTELERGGKRQQVGRYVEAQSVLDRIEDLKAPDHIKFSAAEVKKTE